MSGQALSAPPRPWHPWHPDLTELEGDEHLDDLKCEWQPQV